MASSAVAGPERKKWEVEDIIGHRTTGGGEHPPECLVQWDGHGEDDPEGTSWEPESGVEHLEVLRQYQKEHRDAAAAAASADGESATNSASGGGGGGSDGRHNCAYCGKRCSNRSKLLTHERVHTGEKPFLCSLCPKRFNTKGHIAPHERMHAGEKPYQCSLCPKRFKRKSDVTPHERTHTGEKCRSAPSQWCRSGDTPTYCSSKSLY